MMTDLEAFFCQNEKYDVKTIMSEQRLEGKFIFLVRAGGGGAAKKLL